MQNVSRRAFVGMLGLSVGAVGVFAAGAAVASPSEAAKKNIAPTAPSLAPQKPGLSLAAKKPGIVNDLPTLPGRGPKAPAKVARPPRGGRGVPEFDGKSLGAAGALLIGGVAVLVDRQKRKADAT